MSDLHESYALEGVSDELLIEVLGTHPEGTEGWRREVVLIKTVNFLCRQYGYGAVPQLAAWIEDIWRNPENIQSHRERSLEQREFIESTRKHYEKEAAAPGTRA